MSKITDDEIESIIKEKIENFEMPMPTIIPIEQTKEDKENRMLNVSIGYKKEVLEKMQKNIREDVFNILKARKDK